MKREEIHLASVMLEQLDKLNSELEKASYGATVLRAQIIVPSSSIFGRVDINIEEKELLDKWKGEYCELLRIKRTHLKEQLRELGVEL